MVRAILDGRKTQTRRVVKPQPDKHWAFNLRIVMNTRTGRLEFVDDDYRYCVPCPYGIPGDRLWGREAWTPDHAAFYPNFPIVYRADQGYEYKRNKEGKVYSPEQKAWYPYRWRPSIHMPRAASRITLEITGIRVERLQDISEDDAIAEGAMSQLCSDKSQSDAMKFTHRNGFINLWHQINGSESWAANPWVWVIEWPQLKVNA